MRPRPETILEDKKNFICENRDNIINILYAAADIIPQRLPFQKIILKSIIIPAIDHLLKIVCNN